LATPLAGFSNPRDHPTGKKSFEPDWRGWWGLTELRPHIASVSLGNGLVSDIIPEHTFARGVVQDKQSIDSVPSRLAQAVRFLDDAHHQWAPHPPGFYVLRTRGFRDGGDGAPRLVIPNFAPGEGPFQGFPGRGGPGLPQNRVFRHRYEKRVLSQVGFRFIFGVSGKIVREPDS